MNVVISPYSTDDQKMVRKVILDGLAEFGFEYNPKLDFDLEDPKKYYLKNGGIFYVLKNGKKIIGTVAIIKHGKKGELKRMYVEKAYQGKGYGSKLLDAAIQFCLDNQIRELAFETNKKFIKAHILYQKRGFKVIKEDQDSYYMKKTL